MYYGNKNLDVDFNVEMLQFSESKHNFELLINEKRNSIAVFIRFGTVVFRTCAQGYGETGSFLND